MWKWIQKIEDSESFEIHKMLHAGQFAELVCVKWWEKTPKELNVNEEYHVQCKMYSFFKTPVVSCQRISSEFWETLKMISVQFSDQVWASDTGKKKKIISVTIHFWITVARNNNVAVNFQQQEGDRVINM